MCLLQGDSNKQGKIHGRPFLSDSSARSSTSLDRSTHVQQYRYLVHGTVGLDACSSHSSL